MDVQFIRVPRRECDAVVRLRDGRVMRVINPGNVRQIPPHDVAQFIVEHTLGWQTGFWGYVARGIVFDGMEHESGRRALHGEERSRTAIRGAKHLLAEAECLAGMVYDLVRDGQDGELSAIARVMAGFSWPPDASAPSLNPADVQRACQACRAVADEWRALPMQGSLSFRWSFRAGAHAPANPLDEKQPRRRDVRSRAVRPARR
jgi:hypothetical protein